MKRILLVVLSLMSWTFLHSQSIPIQLMVVDQGGFEMPNTQVKLRLTMRGDTSSTVGQFQEVHNVSTNNLGVVSVDLGEGVVTTNSQVLGIDLFSFGIDEPYIKTELDTSISPTSYTNLGWMKYRYPLVARRALMADSAHYSDSASYLINEKSEWMKDSSETNELQNLVLKSNGYLTLSASKDSIRLASSRDIPMSDQFCLDSDQIYFTDSGIVDICHYEDTTYALKEILRSNDSVFYKVFKISPNQTSHFNFSTSSQNSYSRLFIREKRIILNGTDLKVFDKSGNIIFTQVINSANRLIAIGDSTIFLTNSYSGTSFTIKFRNIFSGVVTSNYKSVCSGCVSRPLPTIGVTSGDTAWINAYNGNEAWMCYGGNLYEYGSSSYQELPNLFKVETDHVQFYQNTSGNLTIKSSIGSVTTFLPVDRFYFNNSNDFSLESWEGGARCRYLATNSHMLFNRYFVNVPSTSSEVLVELIFDKYGALMEIIKSLVVELRVDEISQSSTIKIGSSQCLNNEMVKASSILCR